jgi:hypothetical protein
MRRVLLIVPPLAWSDDARADQGGTRLPVPLAATS